MSKLLVFDFDGVICNSYHDSLMTSINTYIELVSEHDLPVSSKLSEKSVFEFEEREKEFCRMFRELMPLGNFAHDYYVILRIVEQNVFNTIKTQEDFDKFKKSCSPDIIDSYQKRFYKVRYDMQTNDPEAWVGILPAFTGVIPAVTKLSEKYTLAIATSKDVRSVEILLKEYDLINYFEHENILDKDYARSKREHLVTFSKKHAVDFSDMSFIDDKVLHLVSVRDLGVNLFLATWGFNTEREYDIARANGCRLLKLDELNTL
ncbi:HAD family hydrolase [bacterium]|nr:HAD family hydrolase [bacterium]